MAAGGLRQAWIAVNQPSRRHRHRADRRHRFVGSFPLVKISSGEKLSSLVAVVTVGGKVEQWWLEFWGRKIFGECFVPMVVGSSRDLVRMGKKYTGRKVFVFFESSAIIEWFISFSTIVVSIRWKEWVRISLWVWVRNAGRIKSVVTNRSYRESKIFENYNLDIYFSEI